MARRGWTVSTWAHQSEQALKEENVYARTLHGIAGSVVARGHEQPAWCLAKSAASTQCGSLNTDSEPYIRPVVPEGRRGVGR